MMFKGVANTGEITGENLAITLEVGVNVGEEVVEVEAKHKHLEYKSKPKVDCCPKCEDVE